MKKLSFIQNQKAIFCVNDIFSALLSQKLNLTKVLGPIIIDPSCCLNDNLTGNNKPIKFYAKFLNNDLEIVQSLAKWKRVELKKHNFKPYSGLYVDMKAIRSHETLDSLHSFFVDQWDWEMVIKNKDRNIKFLFDIVKKIYCCLYETENKINSIYPFLTKKLPKNIKFFSSQEVEDNSTNKNFNETIYKLCKKWGAIFVYQIGWNLKSGKVFDSRSPEYDDWKLNGDIFVYSKIIDNVIEISSMGIRVNRDSLIKQAKISLNKDIKNNYHKAIIENKLPLTIGGGIGQSRLNMFLLEKKHIGEVQSSVWDNKTHNDAIKKKITLL